MVNPISKTTRAVSGLKSYDGVFVGDWHRTKASRVGAWASRALTFALRVEEAQRRDLHVGHSTDEINEHNLSTDTAKKKIPKHT